MLNPFIQNITLSNHEYNKYTRHLILDNVGTHGQKRLKATAILFIGAGGLACPAIIYLACAGIGHIGVIDNDKVSLSNLHRQILYNYNDINKLKVNIAEQKVHHINYLCKISTYPYLLKQNNADPIIRKYDIIIDASDNFKTRYIINHACQKFHKIHIYGAIQNYEGQISVFNYKNGPNYSDIYPQKLNLKNNNCNNLGVLGTLPGIIGTLQATEAIKIILGIGTITSGYLLTYNALTTTFKKIKIYSNRRYKSNHVKLLSNKNGIYQNKKLKIRNYDGRVIIIDVRNNQEFNKSHLKYSINIPLKEIARQKTIRFIYDHCSHKNIILYCDNRSRSTIASKILNKHNIKHSQI
uniref:Probable molybdopterin-synthase adenylyltransferase n=1 Tax=Schizymenia dubyi TaxID=38368 RepID=A0A1C9C9I2_9FLOR|nr:molybdopterin biosynthesis protein [Schizymenia dubyi]AOM65043.1 molybdopterin biosynthesis protein [Schizymenia dubyi]